MRKKRIQGGQDYDVVIERELSASKVVIVIWSGLSRQSKWVKEEATRALKRDALIPVTFDYTEPPLGFGLSHVIQFSNSNNVTSEEFAKLYQSIQNKMCQEVGGPLPEKKKIKQNGDVKRYLIYISCALIVGFGVFVPAGFSQHTHKLESLLRETPMNNTPAN